jgi:hypothetical protein
MKPGRFSFDRPSASACSRMNLRELCTFAQTRGPRVGAGGETPFVYPLKKNLPPWNSALCFLPQKCFIGSRCAEQRHTRKNALSMATPAVNIHSAPPFSLHTSYMGDSIGWMRKWLKWLWLMVRIEYHAMRCPPCLSWGDFDYHFDRALELIREAQRQETRGAGET